MHETDAQVTQVSPLQKPANVLHEEPEDLVVYEHTPPEHTPDPLTWHSDGELHVTPEHVWQEPEEEQMPATLPLMQLAPVLPTG